MPPGAVDASVHTGCRASCLTPGSAFATVHVVYPEGTNGTLLALALVEALGRGGWNVTESSDTRALAHTDTFSLACSVGPDANARMAIDCTVDRP